ncbi:hypothetical protein PISMIDRAFT_11819 [Pisolithus microcarpus 441]|uniref:Uncharacterized protein n=1 Tax=Pisolithus microcarpus 441 TaxID=765257 RepID=A0A0C9YBI4_9AGAM|nr:hypothetical protein BKA83DRAFT_11819 [Pisolithus microcarpus]KIK22095.1 hypothetical protein PISMIDRAFT_11819 [Pisolithus microcarpus 441]
MSLVLTGTPSLRELFDILERPDQTEWRDLKQQLISRTSNVTLVGSLAIAGSISFVTSKSPSPIAAWDNALPYISLFAGGLCSVLSVVSGLGLVMFLNAVQRQTVRDIQASTFKLIVVAVLLGMPFFWLFMGIVIPIMGMAAAVWLGDDTFAKAVLLYHETHDLHVCGLATRLVPRSGVPSEPLDSTNGCTGWATHALIYPTIDCS